MREIFLTREQGLGYAEIDSAVGALLEQFKDLKKVLVLPPDYTRCYAYAGEITRMLYRRPATKFTAAFLGDADFLNAKYLRTENDLDVFETRAGELRVHPDGQSVRPAPGEACTLMIRPEAVRPCPGDSAVNVFRCVIRDSVFLGETTGLTLDVSGITLHASESAAPERRIGDEITCSVPPDAIAVLPPENDR